MWIFLVQISKIHMFCLKKFRMEMKIHRSDVTNENAAFSRFGYR